MEKVLNMTYASSLTNLCEVNSSFDSGILRICYTGANRNNSFISRRSIERNIKTIYNCPIVCNYDRETDTLGGHDVEVVRDNGGQLHIVNVTQPVGVIPESARVWFEDYTEEDGTVHEYLYAEVLLWKRQEAYRKIKEDGITAHSMELTVTNGSYIDRVYHINDFEFTAFTLIGVEPCFESSALETFSKHDFKEQLSEMMDDLKEVFSKVNTSNEDDDTHPQKFTEGGNKVLEEKKELMAKYGIDIDTLDFSIEDFTVEELTEKFEAIKSAQDNSASVKQDSDGTENKFGLISNLIDELRRVLSAETVTCECCEISRYWYVDCDIEANEVYCWDTNDWLLYGFTYVVDGDSVAIDYESKTRKKWAVVDFDEGEQDSPFGAVFGMMRDKLSALADIENKFNAASDTISSLEREVTKLRKFKSDTEDEIARTERDNILCQFEDLYGVDAFENLRSNCMEYDLETLEEKCFAIRGRNGTTAKFSVESGATKLRVDKTDIDTNEPNEPYGGLFVEYKTDGGSN